MPQSLHHSQSCAQPLRYRTVSVKPKILDQSSRGGAYAESRNTSRATWKTAVAAVAAVAVNGAGAMDPGFVGGPAEQLVTGRQGSPSYGSIDDGEQTNTNDSKDRSEYSFAPYMAEFVGTCILVFTFGCVALSPAPYVYKPTAAACIVTVMVYSTATVSGGHLNPAVSLTLSALGLIPWQRMLGFWLVQVAAGMAGATALRALLGMDMAHTPWPPAPVPPNLGAAVLAELLYTTLLCFLVSCCLVSKRNNPEKDQSQSFGLAIGLLYVAGVAILII